MGLRMVQAKCGQGNEIEMMGRRTTAPNGKTAEFLKNIRPEGTVHVDAHCNKQDIVETANFTIVRMFVKYGEGYCGVS